MFVQRLLLKDDEVGFVTSTAALTKERLYGRERQNIS
jgi:hypothetical protein